MVAQTNHQTTKYATENKWHDDLFNEWGKTYTAKTSPSDFQVTTLEIPLLSQQAVTSKRILVLYTNLQLNPYPNTQLDLFCSDNFFFWCTAPKYVSNQLRKS